MKIFAIILIVIHSVLSENPTCGFYDFNDPSILSEFEDCTLTGSRPLEILSYDGSIFPPFREDSQSFLTTNKSVHSNITQCISTKIPFRVNFSSISFQLGVNMRNNKDTDQYNDVQFFISDILAFQINANTNNWTLYKREYSVPGLGVFDNVVIGLKVRIGSNSDIAVEYLKFYDQQLTDENCVPLHETTESPTTETQPPTTETQPPTTETQPPTTETQPPTTETQPPTTETQPPTTQTQPPTTETERELPACLKVDFNNPTALVGVFKECHLQYLPKLIIKSYLDTTTLTPYRDTSQFYLSNQWEGLSCLETISTFPLPESSFVDSVIFLNGAWLGAWIEISVVDIYTGEHEVVKSLSIENNWVRLAERIKRNYSNAQFMIKTNMNGYSELAVEYFNVLSDSC